MPLLSGSPEQLQRTILENAESPRNSTPDVLFLAAPEQLFRRERIVRSQKRRLAPGRRPDWQRNTRLEMGKTELAKLALEIVGAAGTAGSAYMSQNEMAHAGGVSVGGASGSAAAMLTDQFVEATNYVQANGNSATLVGLKNHLDSKNLSIAPIAALAAAKIGLNTPDLMDSTDSVKISTAQCVADITETALDVSIIAVGGLSVAGWIGAAVTGVGLVAQLYATGVSCTKAAVQGIHAVSSATGKAARDMAVIQGRITGYVNRFILNASATIAVEYSPSKHDYSRIPKPALSELQLGLLSSLQLAELLPPLQFLKNISSTRLSASDAAHMGRAVVLMYKLERSSDQSFSAKDNADAKAIEREFMGLNLATAYNKFFSYGSFASAVTKKSS